MCPCTEHNKYNPCSWGAEMLKKICFFPLPSFRCLDLGWPTSQSPGGCGWTESPWAERPGSWVCKKPPGCTPVCRQHLASQIRLWSCRHWPSLSFFFFFFKRSLYRCCFSPKPRVGAVIVMPRNSRPGSSLAQNSYRARGRLGIPLGTDLWVLWWWMGVEERRYSRSPVGWGDQLPSFCRESVWGS